MKSGGSRSAVNAMASATLACPSSPEPKSPTTKNRNRDCFDRSAMRRSISLRWIWLGTLNLEVI
jgi:hypothetical protein